MRVTWTWNAQRAAYYVRKKGAGAGAKGDTKDRIPDEVFTDATPRVNPRIRTKRGDQLAAAFAQSEQNRADQKPAALPRSELNLADVWRLYERTNPNQVKAETLRIYGKWARAACRCRCPFHDDGLCVAHRPPSTITLAVMEELRNARMQECRACGIREDEHPERGTWRDRETPTHAYTRLSPRSCANELGFVRVLIDFAVERADKTGVRSKALTRTPVIVGGKKGVYPKAKLRPAEFFRVLAAIDALPNSDAERKRYRAMYALAVATGLREHPLTHFDRRWYDSELRMIHVPADQMKGRRDDYRPLDVPVSKWAAHFLEESISPERLLVFPSPAKPEQAQQNFDIVERKLTELADLPQKLTWHALRGTFNSWMITHRCDRHTAEVSFFVREKLMGHALPPQVEAYSDFSDAVLREALDVIDCIFDTHLRDVAGVVPFRRPA